MSWNSSTPVPDRIFASLPYLLPLIGVVQFGKFLFEEFPFFLQLFTPIFPLMGLYYSIPYAGLIIFFVLLLAVVRNDNISRFIRFNTMQAILLDILLSITGLVVQLLGNGLPLLAEQTLFNMLFLGTIAAVVYSVVQSCLGRYADIPTISQAAYTQVR